MCNVPRRAWWRLTNVQGKMFAQGVGKQDELYYADQTAARVGSDVGDLLADVVEQERRERDGGDADAGDEGAGGGPGLKSVR
jgi:hypothetical protein